MESERVVSKPKCFVIPDLIRLLEESVARLVRNGRLLESILVTLSRSTIGGFSAQKTGRAYRSIGGANFE